MSDILKQLDPKAFFKSVPTSLRENIEWRKEFHAKLDKDEGLQRDMIQLCLLDPKIAFNACFWTANPRGMPGTRNWPFILRPKQMPVVDTLKYCIENQEDVGINKSRDEGCTELVCKTAALYCFVRDTYGIVGSRNQTLVDCLGDPYTLMAKIDYAFATMPEWMQKQLGPIERKEMQIRIPKFNSTIKGETTNESFSAGRRATYMFLDEFGRVEPRIAKAIEGSIHDVTGCVIYGSTHWYGESHPFNEALLKNTTHVVSLPWWENPVKNAGLYTSPDYNVIEILDVQYYKDRYPKIPRLHTEESFQLSKLDKDLLASGYEGDTPKFVADGCDGIPGDVRSPWHDAEEEKRKGNKRDFISNIWMSPIGSQSSFFDGVVLERVKSKYMKLPSYEGEFQIEYESDGRVSRYSFANGVGRKRLKWWGQLKNLKPFPNHNFVIGCDLSYGSGNSNSVAAIYDVSTSELVGTWVCPNTSPDKFIDIVVALARWCNDALVIYETTGPGINAHKRMLFNHFTHIYVQRTEETKLRKKKNKYGWSPTPQAKEALLGDLGVALSESLKKSTDSKKCIIHDAETIKELYSYVFYESGDIGASEFQDVTSGARKRHGDRVIAVGLALLGSKYQPRTMSGRKVIQPAFGSFVWRQQREDAERVEGLKYRRDFYG